MVIPDYGRGDTPWRKSSQAPKSFSYTANPMDRLAAQIFDLIVLLIPVFMLLSAPFKSRLYHGFLIENQDEIVASMLANLATAGVVFVLYNSISLYFFRTTVGKHLFHLKIADVWDGNSISYWRCLGRSILTIVSFLSFGFAFLPMLSNDRRRSLADLCFDTEIISAKPNRVAMPNRNERSFVRSVFLASMGAVTLFSVYFYRELASRTTSDTDLSAWFSDRAGHCAAIDDAVAAWPHVSNQRPNRLDVTLAMYAAGLVDRRCLQSEADTEAAFAADPDANYYLAQSFVHTDDTEISDNYLQHVCQRDSSSSSCEMSRIVADWSEKNWGVMQDSFQSMKKPDAFAAVWAIRFFMRQGQAEQAHSWIERISPNRVLAPFLQVQRVKSLWLMDRHVEAKMGALSGLEWLPDEWQVDLASWMCTQEAAVSCADSGAACRWLSEQNLDGGDQDPQLSVALLHNSECSNGEIDYGTVSELNSSVAWKKLIHGLSMLKAGDRSTGMKMIRTVMNDEKTDDPIRAEAFRRYFAAADDRSLERLAKDEDQMPRGLWREVQSRFYRELVARHLSESNSKLAHAKSESDSPSRRPASSGDDE